MIKGKQYLICDKKEERCSAEYYIRHLNTHCNKYKHIKTQGYEYSENDWIKFLKHMVTRISQSNKNISRI